jgi:hypothetical protein
MADEIAGLKTSAVAWRDGQRPRFGIPDSLSLFAAPFCVAGYTAFARLQ